MSVTRFWTSEDHSTVAAAQTFADLLPTALTVVKRMPPPVAMVSGPMSTGGFGSLEKNIELFIQAIQALNASGVSVFDQMPFQKSMVRLLKRHRHQAAYYMPLLEDFYQPLFESGLISTVYFLPDWHTSFGATWERKQCKKCEIEIKEFPTELLSV